MEKLTINDPAPQPDAKRVAEVVDCDGNCYLFWRAAGGNGKRIAEIEWPKNWPTSLSKRQFERRGFEFRVL